MNVLILLLYILIAISATCLVVLSFIDDNECHKVPIVNYPEVLDNYHNYNFKNKYSRNTMRIIAEYKVQNTKFKDLELGVSQLTDYALYLIVTTNILESSNIRKLLVISHSRYVETVQTYDIGLGKFVTPQYRELANKIYSTIIRDGATSNFEAMTDEQIYQLLLDPKIPEFFDKRNGNLTLSLPDEKPNNIADIESTTDQSQDYMSSLISKSTFINYYARPEFANLTR